MEDTRYPEQHLYYPMKSSRAISRVRCLYETDVSRTVSVIIIEDVMITDQPEGEDLVEQ
jgi:hypothetical protein